MGCRRNDDDTEPFTEMNYRDMQLLSLFTILLFILLL